MLASPCAEAGGFIKSEPHLERPDLQLNFVIAMLDDHGRKLHYGNGFSCHVCVLRPKSVGEVGLHDSNPLSAPRIDPQFLSHPEDVATLLKGARLLQKVMRAPAMADYRDQEVFAAENNSDEALIKHMREHADTIYHPVGTCKMGVDPLAVVDPQLRVHGISGLRVADASIMPTLIGGNTNAPSIMIGERAADFIRG